MNEQHRRMNVAAWSGWTAIAFVTDPAYWPAFRAFAESKMGNEWTEADRLSMRSDGRLLVKLAEALEEIR